ncbi:MAG: acyl carrier protein [Lachnospiraceae bacterium]|nr:acyl carrier protein [Candidatus Hippenecus merdae]
MPEKVIDIIADYMDVPKEDITQDTLFFADLHMDSMEILGMICKIEEEFGVKLPTEEMKNIYSVGDLQTFLEEKIIR